MRAVGGSGKASAPLTQRLKLDVAVPALRVETDLDVAVVPQQLGDGVLVGIARDALDEDDRAGLAQPGEAGGRAAVLVVLAVAAVAVAVVVVARGREHATVTIVVKGADPYMTRHY